MNSTNRGMNRLLLLITGTLLLTIAATALILAVVPAVLSAWGTQSRSIINSAPNWIGAPAVGSVSLFALAVGLIATVLAVLLVVFIARQGRGRTTRVLEQSNRDAGTTLIELGVPKALLQHDLSERPEFISTRISAYDIKSTPTLKISVQCRRGTSPVDAARVISQSLAGLDAILGDRLPALVEITGGFRSRTSSRTRLT